MYRTAETPREYEPAKIDVRHGARGWRLVVLSGDPTPGDCRECGHLAGFATWWCEAPTRDRNDAHCCGNCEHWTAPPRAEAAPAKRALSWWQRLWGAT